MTSVAPLHRTLDQELHALLRGASLECLVCGEFILRAGAMIACPECGSRLTAEHDLQDTQLQFGSQAG